MYKAPATVVLSLLPSPPWSVFRSPASWGEGVAGKEGWGKQLHQQPASYYTSWTPSLPTYLRPSFRKPSTVFWRIWSLMCCSSASCICHRNKHNKHSESYDWSLPQKQAQWIKWLELHSSTKKAAWAVKFCFSVTMTWHWSNGWCWGQTN